MARQRVLPWYVLLFFVSYAHALADRAPYPCGEQIQRLPRVVQQRYLVLQHELAIQGPVRGNWPNYSKLDDMRHHCHVKKGRPTYVAVWEVTNVQERIIEGIYVGTDANAPY
jgi:hypothetical protein